MDRCAGIWTIFVCYKKSVTEGFVYSALSMIENKTKQSPLPIAEQALENVMPAMTPKGQLPANFHCRWAILPRRYRQAYRPWSGARSLRQTLGRDHFLDWFGACSPHVSMSLFKLGEGRSIRGSDLSR
jgi:Ribosomal protein S7p/S5e